MLIKSKYMYFIPSLIMGSIITISSSSWFAAWIGLEINLMSFAPILINRLTFQSIESTIKYFIVQAVASTMLIFFVFLTLKLTSINFINTLESVMSMTLLLKAGVAPLHFWFPQVMLCSDWPQCMILLTWQKLAPFILLSFLSNTLTNFAIYTSAVIGTLGAINQTSLKKIMTYSSINHSAWMIALILLNELTWMLYFSSYIIMTLSVIYIFNTYSIDYLSAPQMIKMNIMTKIITSMNFLSLAGMPPMLGFIIKLTAISAIISVKINIMLILFLLSSSFLALYFYLRTMYSAMFINHSAHTLIHSVSFHKNNNNLYCVFSLLGTVILPVMVLLI